MELDSRALGTPDLLDTTVLTPAPDRRVHRALRVLQLGAIIVVLAVTTWKTFELDRFFVPKELALHATALIAGLLAVRSFRRAPFTRIDILLAGYLLLGVISALLATNGWVATRALTISASGIAIFWTARAVRTAGHAWPLLVALAIAVVVAAGTSLLQTYGLRTDLFSVNRAPGGTLGNRNFVAHIAAFGLPIVLFVAISARRWSAFVIGALGAGLVAAVLVLTRSRAGWLAVAAALVVFLVAFLRSPVLRAHKRSLVRIATLMLLGGAGAAAAVVVPNSLRWRSDNPYLDSLRGVANFQEGSGRGRLVQYRSSLRMALSHPIVGVGPGNWAVEYPDFAARRDPSLDNSEPGTTANPWPSSDWVAAIAERGVLATLALVFALVGMAIVSLRSLGAATTPDDALSAAALLGTLAAVVVAGTFDAVLLLALPALFVWAALGALFTTAHARPTAVPEAARVAALVLVATLGAGVGMVRSAAQLAGMGMYANTESVTWRSRASRIDPGSYRLHIALARPGTGLNRASRCRHATAARALYPNAAQARSLASGCD